MSKVAQKFTCSELTRAIKAAEATKLKVSRAEIGTDGTIRVFGQSDPSSETDREISVVPVQ